MDMDALVPTAASHLLSTQRLGHHHAWPPGVSLQFSPHQGPSTERKGGSVEGSVECYNILIQTCVVVIPLSNQMSTSEKNSRHLPYLHYLNLKKNSINMNRGLKTDIPIHSLIHEYMNIKYTNQTSFHHARSG